MKKIVLLISVIFLFATSCEEETEPLIFEATLIGKGALCCDGAQKIPRQNRVITSNGEWSTLLEIMNTVNDVSSTFTETTIDFSRYQVIAVFEEIRYRDGHSIDITEVVEADNSIEVKVENLNKGNSTPAIKQPFHIVKIPKISKPVVFSFDGTLVTIGKGNLSGNGAENISKQNIVITNQTDWTALLSAMNTVGNVTDIYSIETEVDFDRFQIIAAFDELKLYTGSTIDITEITETESSIDVTIENIHPAGLLAALSQPFHIVKIPKSSKQVVFSSLGEFITIGKGALPGSETGVEYISKQNTTITNQTDWTALLSAMNTIGNVTEIFSIETEVDFDRFQIIAVFDELKPFTGSTIDITEVTEMENSIRVKVENIHPIGYGSASSQPFHIVKIPKSPKPVEFI